MNKTVSYDEARGALVIIDQTLLPGREELLCLTTAEEIRDAIMKLKVRGAPAIGAAAAVGLCLEARAAAEKYGDGGPAGAEEFFLKLQNAKEKLNSARPTAVNLSWALNRMERVALEYKAEPPVKIAARLKAECLAIMEEDGRVCAEIGRRGLELLRPGMRILTHCNAGRLATVSAYGTATAPIYLGCERGYGFKVFCDETRPLLQGARLTAYELAAAGVDVTLLCDNMAPSLMSAGRIDAVLVGCDRVAANGDVANKVGTSYVAIAAKHFGIPFYVCGPMSTFDFACESGRSIVIEQRGASEVTEMWYKERMAPADVKVFNPSFDVTPSDLITAFVTERGVIRPPYEENLRAPAGA